MSKQKTKKKGSQRKASKSRKRSDHHAMTVTVHPTAPTMSIVAVEANGRDQTATDAELVALDQLDKKLLVARDRIRMVARGKTPGFYWHGRPGTCKTHTVLAVLDEMGVKYHYHKGNITQGGLLEIMEQHHDEIIVLDDLSAIFDDKKAVQYLLAALDANQESRCRWATFARESTFPSTSRAASSASATCRSRRRGCWRRSRAVSTRSHIPRPISCSSAWPATASAKKVWPVLDPKLAVDQVNEVINWVWDESKRINAAIDLRVLFDKALPDYLAWHNKETEAHWKDLVTTTLEEEVNALAYTPPSNGNLGVRQATKEEEWQIVRSILKDYSERKERIWAWRQRTKKSEKAFERRWAEIKAQDMRKNVSEVSELWPKDG